MAREMAIANLVIRRELHPPLLLLLLAGAGAAAVAAQYATPRVEDLPTLADVALRRFDLTALFAVTAWTALRIPLRFETDAREQWLEPLVAAGASRIRYALSVMTGVYTAAAVIFLVVAATFAVLVATLHGSDELLRLLPRTVARGMILLAHWCTLTALLGVMTRRAAFSLVLTAGIVLPPYLLMLLQLRGGDAADGWILELATVLPPLVWGGNALVFGLQLVSAAAFAALTAMAAHRLIGRRA